MPTEEGADGAQTQQQAPVAEAEGVRAERVLRALRVRGSAACQALPEQAPTHLEAKGRAAKTEIMGILPRTEEEAVPGPRLTATASTGVAP